MSRHTLPRKRTLKLTEGISHPAGFNSNDIAPNPLLTCHNCKKENLSDKAKFCTECGVDLGDVEGHDFHGNQWTSGGGGSSSGSKASSSVMPPYKRDETNKFEREGNDILSRARDRGEETGSQTLARSDAVTNLLNQLAGTEPRWGSKINDMVKGNSSDAALAKAVRDMIAKNPAIADKDEFIDPTEQDFGDVSGHEFHGNQWGGGGGGGAHSRAFVSPNTGPSMSYHEALQATQSPEQKQLAAMAVETAQEVGVTATASNAVGAWKGDAENSIMLEMTGQDEETHEYIVAKSAMNSHQIQALITTDDDNGDSSVYEASIPNDEVEAVRQTLSESGGGIYNTVVPSEDTTRLIVFDEGNKLTDAIHEVGVKHGLTIDARKAFGKFLGDPAGESRETAAKEYQKLIEQWQSRHSVAGQSSAGQPAQKHGDSGVQEKILIIKNLADEFVDTEWDGKAGNWNKPEDMAKSVPDAIASYARAKAKADGTVLTKQYLKLPFREPSGKVNINGVRAALQRASLVKGIPDDVRAAAKKQLEGILSSYDASKEVEAADLAEDESEALDSGLKDIPILRVGPTKNDYEITPEIYNDILNTYSPDEIHMAPIVDCPHEVEEGPALGYITDLYEKPVMYPSGETVTWIYGKPTPASAEGAARIKEIQSGPMMFNSPELVPESEVYGADRTKDWPEGAGSKYYLRRVNYLGAQPPAQFGQKAALLNAESKHRNYNPLIQLSEDRPKMVTKDIKKKVAGEIATLPATVTMATVEEPEPDKLKCPECGAEIEMGDKFCADCGTKMMAEVPADEPNLPAETPKEEVTMGAITGRQNMSEDKRIKTLSDQVDFERATRKGLEKRLAEIEKKTADTADAAIRKMVASDLEKLLGDGKILANESSKMHAVMLDAARNDRKIKLADGTTEVSTYDTLLEHFTQAERLLTPGRLQVVSLGDAIKVKDEGALFQKHLSELKEKNPNGGQANVAEAIRLAEAEQGHKIKVI